MITGTIANGFIQVGIRGLAAAQAQLANLAKGVQGFAGDALKAGAGASVSFATATASVRELVKSADPYGFRQFENAVARLNVQMGRFFIPLLHEVTGLIGRLTGWFRGLSDSTREVVAAVSRFTLAALGLGTALAAVGLFVSGLLGTVARLIPLALTAGKVLAGLFLAANWPLLIAGAAVALAGLVAYKAAGEDLETLWIGLQNAAGAAWEAVKAGWGQLVAFFSPMLNKLGGEFSKAWDRIGSLVSASLKRLEPMLGVFGGKTAELLGQGVAVAARLAEAAFVGLGKMIGWATDALEAAWPYLEAGAGAFLALTANTITVLQTAAKAVAALWDASIEKAGQFIAWCGRAFDGVRKLAGTIADTVGGAFEPVWPDIKAGFQGVGDFIVGVFRRVVAAVNGMIDDMVNGVNGLIDRINASFVGRNVAVLPRIPARQPERPQGVFKPGELEAAERRQSDERWEELKREQKTAKPAPVGLDKPAAPVPARRPPVTPNDFPYLHNPPPAPREAPPPPPSPPKPPPGPDQLIVKLPPPATEPRRGDPLSGALAFLGRAGSALVNATRPPPGPLDIPSKPAPEPADAPAAPKPEPTLLDRLFARYARAKAGPQPEGRFQGQPLIEPKFLGLAEAMRAAQTATVQTPQQAQMEEILSTAKGIKAAVEKTADNTAKGGEDKPFRLAF